jgi:hypothetical protein
MTENNNLKCWSFTYREVLLFDVLSELGVLSHTSMKDKMKCGTMLFFLAAHGGEKGFV